MKNNILLLCLFTAFVILFNQCSSPISDQDLSDSQMDEQAQKAAEHQDFEYRVLSLPTPIQMASIFKAYDFEYDKSVYTKLEEDVYSSKYQRAVIGGIYSTDLGYAIINEDNPVSSEYYEHLIDIFNQLGFSRSTEYMERFQTSQDIRDSLSQIFMATYNEMHQEVIDYKHDEVSYYLLSGCYLESLQMLIQYYITQNRPSKSRLYNNVLSQQILSLNNLIELGSKVEITVDKAEELNQFLHKLQTTFSTYQINWQNETLYLEEMPSRLVLIKVKEQIEQYKKGLLNV